MSGPLYRHRSSGSLWRAVWRNAGPDGGSICMRSHPDNGRIEVVSAAALEREGEFVPADERSLQGVATGDHGVIVVGPTCRSISCWLTQYDRSGRREFPTTSVSDALVFLPRNGWEMQRAQEDWPNLRFRATRDMA